MSSTNNIKLTMQKPIAYDSAGDICMTTTKELSKTINDVFGEVFKDYVGCSLRVIYDQNRLCYTIVPKLIFQVLPEDQYNDQNAIFAFKPLAKMAEDSVIGRVQRLSHISNTGYKVNVTEEAKSIMEDFTVAPALKGSKFDWNQSFEINPTERGTFIVMIKLDLTKIVRRMYGERIDGSSMFYQVTPTAVLNSQNQYKAADNWGLCILRLNESNFAKSAELFGLNMPAFTTIPGMVTEKHEP